MPETSGHQPFLIHHLPTVDSTNTYLKGMREAPEWTVVTADEQTAGRGRQSNQWHSAAGAGLYLSALLCPGTMMRKAGWLSLLAAVADSRRLHLHARRPHPVTSAWSLITASRRAARQAPGSLQAAVNAGPSGSPSSRSGTSMPSGPRPRPPPRPPSWACLCGAHRVLEGRCVMRVVGGLVE